MNNPIPPQEASGTSGMKAAVNGVLNFSIADGWWIEGYNGEKRLDIWKEPYKQ
jgi:starch phosphorylase